MVASAKRGPLLEMARGFVDLAREEAEFGYSIEDLQRVRDAAEKAWLAVNQATDHAMLRHGQIPEPGPRVHASRLEFLERVGRGDLSEKLSFFADRLHGQIFYIGAVPEKKRMGSLLDQVADYVRRVTEET